MKHVRARGHRRWRRAGAIGAGVLTAVIIAVPASDLRSSRAPQTEPARRGQAGISLVVDHGGDDPDQLVGDGRCRTASGVCTLRAAIEESNATSSSVRVRFAVPVPRRKDGTFETVIIQPTSPLPDVATPIHLDGPTQPGARPNTAASPKPFNGKLGVVLDGSALARTSDAAGLVITPGASGSTIDGLVINSFPGNGIQVTTAADIHIIGSYIGTDPAGLRARGNLRAGINAWGDPTPGKPGVVVGGSKPRDRNIISGNFENAAYPRSRWTIAGNYIGLGADGVADVGNGNPAGSGALSIDDADDVVVGGDAWVDANIFAWNRTYGIAPQRTNRLTISHNLIGVAADGRTPAGNHSAGIIMDESDSATISANTIMHNAFAGLLVAGSRNVTVGGAGPGAGNLVSANRPQNIAIWSQDPRGSEVKVLGNSIGTTSYRSSNLAPGTDVGVSITGPIDGTVIGGTGTGEANVIAGSRVAGVAIMRMRIQGSPLVLEPSRTAVLGNRFIGNGAGVRNGQTPTDIDYLDGLDNSEPIDLLPDVFSCTVGGDSGPECADRPRAQIELTSARVAGSRPRRLVIDARQRSADRATGPVRLEVYRRAERQGDLRYLGAASVVLDPSGTAEVTLGEAVSTGEEVLATITPIDPTSPSGFGDTSEFSPPIRVRS